MTAVRSDGASASTGVELVAAAAGDRFKGSGVLCPDEHELSFTSLAPAGESPAAYARAVRPQPL